MIKAIFFDIDGTLVSFQTHRVSDALLDGLHRLRGRGMSSCWGKSSVRGEGLTM